MCGSIARDRKSTRLNSSHVETSYAVFCLKKQRQGAWLAARLLHARLRRRSRRDARAARASQACGEGKGRIDTDQSCEFFFFNDTATTEIYTFSLHDALPI